MKLFCGKCNKQLTVDMYPVKIQWFPTYFGNKILNRGSVFTPEGVSEYDGDGLPIGVSDSKMKRGLFFMSKASPKENNKYCDELPAQIIRKRLPEIVVGESSLVAGIIPPFKSGHGCCNYSMGETLSCDCGNEIGAMYLDCYESGAVNFIERNVRRSYK